MAPLYAHGCGQIRVVLAGASRESGRQRAERRGSKDHRSTELLSVVATE